MGRILERRLPADEGMREVLDMVKGKHLASLMDTNNAASAVTWISFGANHNTHNGKPYYYSEKQVEDLQAAINWTCYHLNATEILSEAQTKEVYPLCYGIDYVSKFKVLGKVIKLPYLFTNVLGKTKKWKDMHLSQKREVKYYNKFTDDELDMINEGICEVARRLGAIKLEWQSDGRGKREEAVSGEGLAVSEEAVSEERKYNPSDWRGVDDLPEEIDGVATGEWMERLDNLFITNDCLTRTERLDAYRGCFEGFSGVTLKASSAIMIYERIAEIIAKEEEYDVGAASVVNRRLDKMRGEN